MWQKMSLENTLIVAGDFDVRDFATMSMRTMMMRTRRAASTNS